MSEKLCPDCGGDLSIVDGEYDTNYYCKDPDCRFVAHSDTEYELCCDQKAGDKVIDQLRARVAELEANNRWIPVSERMPEPMTELMIVYDGYIVPWGYYSAERLWWKNDQYQLISEKVSHWQLWPELPKEDGQS
jgi:hypothetical protein